MAGIQYYSTAFTEQVLILLPWMFYKMADLRSHIYKQQQKSRHLSWYFYTHETEAPDTVALVFLQM